MVNTILLAEEIVKKAVKRGCDAAEVFIETAKQLSVEARDGRIEALESSRDFGIALRVIKNQKLGFSFTTDSVGIDLSTGQAGSYRDRAGDIVDMAVNSADWTSEDKYVDIPDYNPPADVLVLDEKIKNIKEDDVIKNALLLEKTALDFDTRIKKVRKAEIALATADTTIFNSRGVNFSYESGYFTASVSALASDRQDSQMGFDFAASRRLSDIDFVSVAQGASKMAIDLLGAKTISAVKAPVILEPSVASDFLSIFSASLSAEAVQKKRSFLAGKAGKTITSPIVDIVDDGIMPWGLGTKPVDDEGVPTLKKVIVSKGRLTGFMHNTYTAKKQGVASTGNAARASFKSLPGIGVTNFYIEPGRTEKAEGSRSDPLRRPASGRQSKRPSAKTRIGKAEVKRQSKRPSAKARIGKAEIKNEKDNKLIKSLSKGLLVLEAMGVHTANPVSGDFSIGVSGLWIEKGEIAYPVKEALVSGNILDLFVRIEGVGDDLKFCDKIGSPSLLIGEMDISA